MTVSHTDGQLVAVMHQQTQRRRVLAGKHGFKQYRAQNIQRNIRVNDLEGRKWIQHVC